MKAGLMKEFCTYEKLDSRMKLPLLNWKLDCWMNFLVTRSWIVGGK